MLEAYPGECLQTGIPTGVLLLFLSAVPGFAQVSGEVRSTSGEAHQFDTITVSVDIDMGASGQQLGSYGATLTWDPAVLEYQFDSGGGEPLFDSALVNRITAGSGQLLFADAAASGQGGRINVFNVT